VVKNPSIGVVPAKCWKPLCALRFRLRGETCPPLIVATKRFLSNFPRPEAPGNQTIKMDFLPYWNLRERPFEATWDTRFYFQSRDHDEALNRLGFLVGEKTMNIGMLTGEIGCGKTLTRAVFSQQLNRNEFEVVTQENSAFGFKDLLGAVLNTLDPDGKGQNKFARCERLKRVAERLHAEGRHLVLIFDEAQ
jgi:general secretion pathway protein A